MDTKIGLVPRGFTLIEVLITVVMIGILAAIALPSYQEFIRSTRRGEAKVELMLLAKEQIKWRETDTDYANTDELHAITAIKTIKGADGIVYYNYAVTENTANSFTITATPTGAQSNDSCATLSIKPDQNKVFEITSSNSSCINP